MSSRSMLIRGYIFKVNAILGHVFKVRFCWWSRFIRGTVFKVSVDWLTCLSRAACKAALMLGGEEARAGWLVGDTTALTQSLVSTLSPSSLLAAKEAMFSRSG